MNLKKPHSNHNVYILGAGFPVGSGVPLINNFLTRMADSVGWLQEADRNEEVEAIMKVFEFRQQAAAAAFRARLDVDNIEELFSLASAVQEDNLTKYITTGIAATIDFALTTEKDFPFYELRSECTLKLTNLTLEKNGERGIKEVEHKELLYSLYAQIISGFYRQDDDRDVENTVISFNYDTVLEDSIAPLYHYFDDEDDIQFTYGFPQSLVDFHSSAKGSKNLKNPNLLPIYKLHGSVNWGITKDAAKIKIYGEYEDLRANNENILLVPPTWRKVFGTHLTHIWSKAVDAIREATRIIVIGFSMPQTDAHFKYLIAAGLRNNVSLRKFIFVNPALDETNEKNRQEYRENIFRVLRSDLEEKGVIELLPQTTSDYFLTSENRQTICRHVAPACNAIEYQGVTYKNFTHSL